MIKGNTVAVRANGKWTRTETERTESGEKSAVSSALISMQGNPIPSSSSRNFFFLFFSLFFFLPRTNIPLSTDLVARRKGHSACTSLSLCYIQESITILTSSPSGNSILSVEANRQYNGTDYANNLWLGWSSALKFQHCRSWSFDSNRSITVDNKINWL